jgi:hypothetical protein
MKLADAETLLRVQKEQGPITEPWSVLTDEGVLLEAWPLGFARGSIELSDMYTMFSRWHGGGVFFQGGDAAPHRYPRWSPKKLWEQEQYVYVREMRMAAQIALERLHAGPFYPRPGEKSYNTTPVPSDFHLFVPDPGVSWILVNRRHFPEEELEKVKEDFCELLEVFIKEEKWNGQRKVVRVRSAASSEEDQGTPRAGDLAEVGSVDSTDDDDWN